MPDLNNVNLLFWDLFFKAQHSPYAKVVLIVLGGFGFILLLSLVRKHVFSLSMHGAVFGFVAGIILMLVIDLLIIFGLADKQARQNLTKTKIKTETFEGLLVSGFNNLSKVLGVSTVSSKKPKSGQEVINEIFLLPKEETRKVKELLCE